VSALATGQKIGGYELLRRIGRGGFGEVWSVRSADDSLRALKVLQLISQGQRGGPSSVDRFLAEGRVLCRLQHPNVVRVFEVVDERPGPVAHVMELLEGRSLHALQARLDIGTLLGIVRQIAEALVFVHEQDILHRDVKAGNIFVCMPREGERVHPVKLIDFGIAKALTQGTPHTGTGMLVGTLRSMAPESIERLNGANLELTGAVDQWGLGVTLYRTIYGRPPFDGDSVLAVMRSIKEGPVRFDERPRPNYDLGIIEGELRLLIARLLEKDPAARFPSMQDVLRELRGLEGVVLDGATIARPRPDLPRTSTSGVNIPIALDVVPEPEDEDDVFATQRVETARVDQIAKEAADALAQPTNPPSLAADLRPDVRITDGAGTAPSWPDDVTEVPDDQRGSDFDELTDPRTDKPVAVEAVAPIADLHATSVAQFEATMQDAARPLGLEGAVPLVVPGAPTPAPKSRRPRPRPAAPLDPGRIASARIEAVPEGLPLLVWGLSFLGVAAAFYFVGQYLGG